MRKVNVRNCIIPAEEINETFDTLANGLSQNEIKILKEARYDHLFYTYRCSLVHGFRDPSYTISYEDQEEKEPYYFIYENETILHLGFPVKFFENLVKKCLSGLKNYLIENDINPYEKYELNDCWIQQKSIQKLSQKNATFSIAFSNISKTTHDERM